MLAAGQERDLDLSAEEVLLNDEVEPKVLGVPRIVLEFHQVAV